MTRQRTVERVVAVSQFKARCHTLINQIATGRLRRIVLTKRGKPVAALVPAFPRLRGALKGTVFIPPGVDITEPTGEVWDADS